MAYFINGLSNISPQLTTDNTEFLERIVSYDTSHLTCQEPVYKEYIKPLKLRRMSRVMKFGLCGALMALKDAEIEQPGAIIVGTGYGCIEDTEKFLVNMIDGKEQQLTPTAFMQSTHNTIGGQIAINIGCKNYNATYVHKGASFERALSDAMLHLEEGAKNVLVGGFDECTEKHHFNLGRLDYWKKNVSNLELIRSKDRGTIAGEGAAYFVLSKEKSVKSYAQIKDLRTFYNPLNNSNILREIEQFLHKHDMDENSVDVFVTGDNGDVVEDKIYNLLREEIFQTSSHAYYKHLCGQYDTASAFGMWFGANIIKHQKIPNVTKLNNANRKIRNVLVYNHFQGKYHSLVLLTKC